ncbi:Serine--pyruvate aminotransferase / L-alanine:glyoxylate aminotransferase [invertebrate metagenome]|uniref:Serine--pyruvate aminotransferase / L-alanine:glyoxylate aminotransferase n=1 Tax=invertebrate metagenome TaxID=1711999 RepID=A0A484H7N2_9ZZZZ
MSDAAALCQLARTHGALSIVDVVTSLGGAPVLVDTWGADAVYGGSQKCLSCTPGLALVTLSPRCSSQGPSAQSAKLVSGSYARHDLLERW